MEITFLGHSGFCVETTHANIVIDPWLSTHGAFDSSWFQYPRNQHLASFVIDKLNDTKKDNFVYVSHEHKDHFDEKFLKSLGPTFTYVVPGFRRPFLRDHLANLPCKDVISFDHADELKFKDGTIKIYLDDNEMNRDSAILVKSNGESFLNLNDTKLQDTLPTIAKVDGPFDVFTCQFSGANWHPVCYQYDNKTYTSISKKKMLSKFEAVARSIEFLKPRYYIPAAGPPCFLDPELIEINFQETNNFPRTPKFIKYLNRRLGKIDVKYPELMPGDIIDITSDKVKLEANERVDDNEFEAYIRSYAEDYKHFFDTRKKTYLDNDNHSLLKKLIPPLNSKLKSLTLRNRIKSPLYLGIKNLNDPILRVDFQSGTTKVVNGINDSNYYLMEIPKFEFAQLAENQILWEDLFLTMRVRLYRNPDIYQTIIQGFLTMQPEDVSSFCNRLLEIEESKERINVEADGVRYSIDRFCPHQAGDLKQGWIENGRYLTCPRHRWQFDLWNEGQCTTSNETIRAVALDDEI